MSHINCTCGYIHDGNADEVSWCPRCTANHYSGSTSFTTTNLLGQRDQGDEYDDTDEVLDKEDDE